MTITHKRYAPDNIKDSKTTKDNNTKNKHDVKDLESIHEKYKITRRKGDLTETPLRKKPKLLKNSLEPAPSSNDSQTKSTNAEIMARVKDRLKAFEANELSADTGVSSKSSNSNISKRDRSLPDSNSTENSAIPSTSSSHDDIIEILDEELLDMQSSCNPLEKFEKAKSGKRKSEKLTMMREPIGKVKYTNLEQQYLEIKKKSPDVVLFVECGYRYRFFGEDAEIAARVLKIFSHQDHNFLTASIPTHRLYVHLKRIVSAGYKVGIVKQTQTAALKAAGSNKNTPFMRELTQLYTKSTLIGDDSNNQGDEESDIADLSRTSSGYLACISDHVVENNCRNRHVGIVAVQPSTGDIVFDSFEDNDLCFELENRLAHIQPVEILLSDTVSPAIYKFIRNISTISHNEDDRIRTEKIKVEHFHYNDAVKNVSKFYQEKSSGLDSKVLQEILNLSKPVLCCISALIAYLSDFKLEKILTEYSNFRQFSLNSKYMQLNKHCLKNLEVFQNATDGKDTGSLFWALNQTLTKPGSRLLKMWLSQPLMSSKEILSRQSAIDDLINNRLDDIPKLKGILGRLPDLEKILLAAYHKKSNCSQVYMMLKHFEMLLEEFRVQRQMVEGEGHLISSLLRDIISVTPELLDSVKEFKTALSEKAAMDNNKTNLFTDESHFPALKNCKEEIGIVCKEIQDHRREVRLTVKQPSLEYTTVLGTEYLIEVKNQNISLVPDNWVKISSTKAVSRFHSPFIVEKYSKLQQLREQLVIECDIAWQQFLSDLCEHYQRLKKAIQLISTLDCLLSLSFVAQMHGYTRPEISEDSMCIEVTGGRHPVIQALIGQNHQYVSNDTNLNVSGQCVMIITGPNMGGKSCYIKQVAIMAILTQIGSYIPADWAKLGIFDAIYTRMGAEDMIYEGQSTFMVELAEVSNIMVKATSQSLVILDELGRGTSTHDGVAIAYSVLDYFINQPRCLTLCVTHYPLLAEFEDRYPNLVGNFHMSFLVHDVKEEEKGEDKITFLYQLVKGMAAKSYGLNVACLANIPSDIVEVAARKSRQMENSVLKKRKLLSQFQRLISGNRHSIQEVLKELNDVT